MTRRQNGILRSFLRRHLAGKTAVASRNVDCFLKLSSPEIASFLTWKHLGISSENLWNKIIIFKNLEGKISHVSHALNITILVKEKEIIGGWFYVKPGTSIKSECVFELYRISTESTFALPYM